MAYGTKYRFTFESTNGATYRILIQKEGYSGSILERCLGKAPVLMSQVNPALRASVASSVLRNNGYFRGHVSYEAVPRKNPKKSPRKSPRNLKQNRKVGMKLLTNNLSRNPNHQ